MPDVIRPLLRMGCAIGSPHHRPREVIRRLAARRRNGGSTPRAQPEGIQLQEEVNVFSAWRVAGVALLAAVGLLACGQQPTSSQPSSTPSTTTNPAQSKAADLRTKLDILL